MSSITNNITCLTESNSVSLLCSLIGSWICSTNLSVFVHISLAATTRYWVSTPVYEDQPVDGVLCVLLPCVSVFVCRHNQRTSLTFLQSRGRRSCKPRLRKSAKICRRLRTKGEEVNCEVSCTACILKMCSFQKCSEVILIQLQNDSPPI